MMPPLHWRGGAGQGDAYLRIPSRLLRGPRTWVCRAVVLAILTSMLYPCHCLGDEHDDDDGARTGDDSATDEIQKIRERQVALEHEVRELRERLEAKESAIATLQSLQSRLKTPPTLPPIDPFKPYRLPPPSATDPDLQAQAFLTTGGGTCGPPPPNPLAFPPPPSGGGTCRGRASAPSPPPPSATKQDRRKVTRAAGLQPQPTHIDPRNLVDPWAPRTKQLARRRRGSAAAAASPTSVTATATEPELDRMACPGPVAEHDVVWYLGGRTGDGFQWKPQDQVLGGSEQAVVELSRAWTKQGLQVAVYGAFENQVYDGVTYHGVDQFRGDVVYNTLILWRAVGALAAVTKDQLCARWLVHEIQDSYLYPSIYHEVTPAHKHAPMGGNVAEQVLERFDSVVVKSRFHAEHMGLDPARTAVIPNGVRHGRFSCDGTSIRREQTRFVYASDYSRGLEQILRWFWPALREKIPDAELHIYYGMELHKPAFQGMMADLLDQPGVIEYGKRPVAEISAAKCAAAYHLYYTRTTSETDCVSIRESAFVGCIPILSEHNVFQERAGLHIPGDPEDEDDSIAAAKLVARAVTDSDQSAITSLRRQVVASESARSWDDQARVWINSVLGPSARTAWTVATRPRRSVVPSGKKQTNKTRTATKAGAGWSGGSAGAQRSAASSNIDAANPRQIPRRIIQTWKTADLGALPAREQGFVKQMLAAYPSYNHQLFDDVDVENFIYTRCAPRWIALYETLPTVIQRLDLFRILAVYELGGFYFDVDMSVDGPLPLDALLRHQAVFAEEVHSNTDAFLRVRGITNLYANYAFGGARRHPVFLRILETMEAAIKDPVSAGIKSGMTPFKTILFSTGPVVLTRAVVDFIGDVALPKGERAGIEVLVHAEDNQFGSYGTHHMMHSWV